MKKRRMILIIILFLLIIGAGLCLFANLCETQTIGSNNLGYVTKSTYSHYGDSEHKIAVASGMHSREKLSADVLPIAVKFYALFNKVDIVNYQVTVLDNPDDFYIGRSNGESLVNNYVVNDIAKENFDLVIIGHDHEEGYGDGFYIATPSMDSKSVNLAEKAINNIPNFNYYKRDTTKSAKSSSITTVDNPIVATGTPLFVYEIPEWLGFFEALGNSYSLIGASFNCFN